MKSESFFNCLTLKKLNNFSRRETIFVYKKLHARHPFTIRNLLSIGSKKISLDVNLHASCTCNRT